MPNVRCTDGEDLVILCSTSLFHFLKHVQTKQICALVGSGDQLQGVQHACDDKYFPEPLQKICAMVVESLDR
jgi:hypothetical protein